MERTVCCPPAINYQPSTINSSARRAQPNRYPDFGLDLVPAFPSVPHAGPDSGLWELVIRYSGATVPDSHGVPWHLTATAGGQLPAVFKERFLVTPRPANCQEQTPE